MASENHLIRILLILVATVVFIPILMMLVAWPMMGMWGGGHMWGGGMWSGTGAPWIWLVMWLVPLLILLGGGYLIYRAIRRQSDTEPDAALEELRLAYARGDLSNEEFEERRDRLERET